MSKTTINLQKINALINSLQKTPKVKIGILSNKTRKDSNLDNATIGLVHEFGSSNVPRRSFLRMPIMDNLEKNLEASKAFTDKSMDKVLASGSFEPFMKNVGVIGVATVLDAFATGGDGKWEPLNPKTMQQKKIKQILVESQQLRNSIDFEVV